MRAWLILVVVAGCGKKQESPSAGSAVATPSDVAVAVTPAPPSVDAAVVTIDAAPAVAPPPAVKTGVEIVSFEGIKVDKLAPLARGWIGWIEQHFTKCEIAEQVDPVTTTATITFKEGDLKFDLPKVPDALAECIKKNISTPYLGYEPVVPKIIGKDTLKVKIKIGAKSPPPPPDNSPVKFVASKIKGARDKTELGKWLDANVARNLKRCIEDTPVVQALWKVGFEIDAAGAMSKVTAPGDPNVATCVQKILDEIKAPKASGSNTVELVFSGPQ